MVRAATAQTPFNDISADGWPDIQAPATRVGCPRITGFGVCLAGLRVVTAGQDRLLVLWNMAQRDKVALRTLPDVVSDMAWLADTNALACITESGGVALWTDITPEAAPEPSPSLVPNARGSEGARALGTTPCCSS